MASDYDRKYVSRIFNECKSVDREELIKRPRKKKNGDKKFVLCSKWDPRQPNIKEGLKLFEEILYSSRENEKVFPKGSVIAGFKRQKNIGEIIAPSRPVRVAREVVDRGCFPCNAPRACTLHQSGVLQKPVCNIQCPPWDLIQITNL